jgi:hypothetical protein
METLLNGSGLAGVAVVIFFRRGPVVAAAVTAGADAEERISRGKHRNNLLYRSHP